MSTADPQAPEAFAPPLLLELFSPEARADPYPVYRRYREENPVMRSSIGIWTFTRYEDILAILRDDRFSADHRKATVVNEFFGETDDGSPNPIRDSAGKILLFTDPPDHTRMRTLVNKAFTRRTIEGLRDHIKDLVDDLLDKVQDRDEIDVIADLAYPLPALVICELMGVPTEDRDKFRGWSGEIAPIIDPLTPPDVLSKAVETAERFAEYFAGLLEERRRKPQDDLLTALLDAREHDDKLTEEELLGLCVLVFIAGHETTQNLIGNGLLALLRHPDQLALLREQPSLARNAIEELLRYDSPVQLTGRVPLEDIEVAGETVREGEEAVVLLGSGNRDPDVFDHPDRLDITREKTQIVSFGAGVHFCLGAPLARVEGQIAFTELLRRFPKLELATDEPQWRPTLTLRGLQSLPVRTR
jgi:pimeloyl-[acyl-carrier protein] synthase